jgi:large subunit ribosomal protein L32
MAVPKQHRSKSRQGQRRMHIHLEAPRLAVCPKCKRAILPHIVCSNCGTYQEKQVIDVLSKLGKKERKQKEKEIDQSSQEPKQEPLNPENLSRS